MRREIAWVWFILLLGAIRAPAGTQEVGASPDPDQIQWCKEGILDPSAKPEIRRRWGCRLLLRAEPQAKPVIVELLTRAESPDVQRLMAEAIGECSRANPERLDESLVPPLLDMLGAAAPELRAAAAAALAEFPGPEVPAELGRAARQDSAALAKRFAAVDALAPNVHRREVVKELMELLEVAPSEIAERVYTALQPACRAGFGADREQWRAWWERMSALTDEQWLTDQLRMYRERARATQVEFDQFRENAKRHEAQLATRIGESLREEYRALNPEQRDAKLIEWLRHPLPEVALGAMDMIKAHMADEGKRPAGPVLAALLQTVREGAVALRREALVIVQNLNDPAVIEAVLDRLDNEDDPVTRLMILRAIGKLNSSEAIPALVHEIAAIGSSLDCVREAALALGQIVGKSDSTPGLAEAIQPLKHRYQSAPAGDAVLRAALLSAMAGVADPAFLPDFLEAVDSKDPAVVRAAIRGLRALGDHTKLARFRILTADKDPLLRLAAIEAVGHFGRDDADVETLLPRLNPTTETNERAVQAARRAFSDVMRRRSLKDRIQSVERLRDLPDLEETFLAELAGDLAVVEGHKAELEAILDRLAIILVGQGKYADAARYLRELYNLRVARGDPNAIEVGLRLMDAVLRSPSPIGLGELIQRLTASAESEAARNEIASRFAQYLDLPEMAADTDRSRKLLAELQTIPQDSLSDSWSRLIQRLNAASATSNPDHSP